MKSEENWKKILSEEEYAILRKKGTERAFSGRYYDNQEKGRYHCAGCGQLLFASDAKYDSGSGWPSFYAPAGQKVIREEEDNSLYMQRTEIMCSACGGHLGHIFPDGPEPTGLRYCVNSVSLRFEKETM